MLGSHLVKSWTVNQQTVALSSGEAELYALTRAATQVVGLMQLLQNFGVEMNGIVATGSTAAIFISSRLGLGRRQDVKVQYLWIQEKLQEGFLRLEKVHTKSNLADLMTTSLKKEDAMTHMKAMGLIIKEGGHHHLYHYRLREQVQIFGCAGVHAEVETYISKSMKSWCQGSSLT